MQDNRTAARLEEAELDLQERADTLQLLQKLTPSDKTKGTEQERSG